MSRTQAAPPDEGIHLQVQGFFPDVVCYILEPVDVSYRTISADVFVPSPGFLTSLAILKSSPRTGHCLRYSSALASSSPASWFVD